ncbi:restriction endonuclease subunit S [Yersinia enterocolitica]|uniref:restriction endonuclease subunit S n=1 Tax=Yersinia frederiksenii TaxID=29484 RepID=UPI0005DA7C8C|nr:restriction endonuclease subunit S [Yersinia frederiksenii]ELI8123286.1 restriction endonuclease subunit S [Yersinia enterocolitica]CQI94617.1 Type I restriction enzyme EcoKI specificity protein [Yersinia frederiksenii]
MAKYKAYPEYKDSGVEWLGEMPCHWRLHKAKYIFRKVQRAVTELDGIVTAFRDGQVTLRSNRRVDGFTNALKEIGYQGVKVGDLLVHAMDGFAGAIGISDSDGKCSPVCSVCIPWDAKGTHMSYYGYLVRQLAVTDFILSLAKGIRERSTEFRFSEFSGLFLSVPPLNEQTQIARFLDHETAKIDKLIEKQQQLIELLKEKRQAVISHAVTKGLNPDVPMKDSGVEWLGEVPEHWIVSPLKIHVFTRKGIAFKSTDFCHYGVRVVKASDIKQKSIQTSDVFLPELFALNYPKAILNSGDIVLSTVGSTPDVKNSAVGQIGLVPQNLNGSLLNQNTVVFSSRPDVLNQSYLFFLIQTNVYRDHLDLHAHGTANQASLNITDMLDFKYACPPLIEQVEISEHIQKYNYSFDLLESKSESAIKLLKERRTALISAAVTGKIDVRDWVAPDTSDIEAIEEATA